MKKSLIKPFLLDSIMVNNIEKIDSFFFSNLNVKKVADAIFWIYYLFISKVFWKYNKKWWKLQIKINKSEYIRLLSKPYSAKNEPILSSNITNIIST